MNEYEKQAKDFLKDTGTTLTMYRYSEFASPQANWAPVGFCYRISLEREDKATYKFNFWDSVANMKAHKKPTAYDILASLNDYIDTSMSIDDFANEYGYNDREIDISVIIRSYNDSIEQTRKLRELFTVDQLEQLGEIS